MNFLIKKAIFLDPYAKKEQELDILINGSKIKRIGKGIASANDIVIDAKDNYILPGLVDVHVHCREPGQEHKETIATGIKAAAAGGFTTIVAEPNTDPPIDTPTRLKQVQNIAREENSVNFYSKACITKGQEGEELTDVEALKAAGAVAITDDGHPVHGDTLMRNAFVKAKKYNILLSPHSEESELYRRKFLSKRNNKNADQFELFPERTTATRYSTTEYMSETGFIRRDIKLLRETGARYHVSHVSLAESVKEIAMAKKEGLPITAEVTLHHLLLTQDDAERIGSNAKVNPPLRSKEDIEALKEALIEGIIDIIATDHAPHTPQEKALPWDNAPFGIIGLETALGLALTHLVKPGLLTILQLAEKMSTLPAKIFGLNVGGMEEGEKADFTLVDPDKKWTVDPTQFYSKGRNCPFDKWELQGKAVLTMVGGRIVMKDGQIIKAKEDLEKIFS